ncbi:hypothetical protein RJT34_24323 [Clitoria ternatea]|uniref:Uncharacterized protein n=1 Tax=Clitoria ternatea TaxID=43366 RepID=A0AAN9FQG3_CLITE
MCKINIVDWIMLSSGSHLALEVIELLRKRNESETLDSYSSNSDFADLKIELLLTLIRRSLDAESEA